MAGSPFARNIRAIRENAELTQEQFADAIGVNRQAVYTWEAGRVQKPRQKSVVDGICSAFSVTEQDLFGYADGFYAKLHGLTEAPVGAISPTGSVSAFLPLRGRVHAGDPTDPENLDGTVELPASVAANHPHAYFLEVEGDCMDRVYPRGMLYPRRPRQGASRRLDSRREPRRDRVRHETPPHGREEHDAVARVEQPRARRHRGAAGGRAHREPRRHGRLVSS